MASTVSPGSRRRASIPFMQVLTGSTKQACSNETPCGNFHGSLLDDPIHHPNVFREASAGRLKSSGASDFLVGRALGEGFVPAVVALAAGDVMKDHDAVAGLEVFRRPRLPQPPRRRFRGRRCGARNAIRRQFSSDRCRRPRRYARARATLRRQSAGTGTVSRRTSFTPR